MQGGITREHFHLKIRKLHPLWDVAAACLTLFLLIILFFFFFFFPLLEYHPHLPFFFGEEIHLSSSFASYCLTLLPHRRLPRRTCRHRLHPIWHRTFHGTGVPLMALLGGVLGGV